MSTFHPPLPRLKGRTVAVVAAVWLLYTVLYSLMVVRSGGGGSFAEIFSGQVVWNTIRAVAILPVWWLMARTLAEVAWWWRLPLHGVLAPAYGWFGAAMLVVLIRLQAPPEVVAQVEAVQQWIMIEGMTLYVVQVAVIRALLSQRRLRWREQQAAELMALARTRELAALKAQISPHFLFNTLNAISATVVAQPEAAREMIADLAELMRYALDSSRREWVPLGEEVDFIESYLRMERHRFSDRLEVAIAVDPAVREVPVPPMILQPLVENAIKHGLAPSEAGSTVRLHIEGQPAHVAIALEDTGGGAKSGTTAGAGIGLANTRARLERLYGPAAAFKAAPLAPHGFRVSFHIPQPTS